MIFRVTGLWVAPERESMVASLPNLALRSVRRAGWMLAGLFCQGSSA